jgi:hypothetical protein
MVTGDVGCVGGPFVVEEDSDAGELETFIRSRSNR